MTEVYTCENCAHDVEITSDQEEFHECYVCNQGHPLAQGSIFCTGCLSDRTACNKSVCVNCVVDECLLRA